MLLAVASPGLGPRPRPRKVVDYDGFFNEGNIAHFKRRWAEAGWEQCSAGGVGVLASGPSGTIVASGNTCCCVFLTHTPRPAPAAACC